MDKERYDLLNYSGYGLTDIEFKEGWHWCYDWNGLLVGPGMPELNECTCYYPNVIKARENNLLLTQCTGSDKEKNDQSKPFLKPLPSINNQPIQYGWICPRCNKCHSPYVTECSCYYTNPTITC